VPFPRAGQQFLRIQLGEDLPNLRGRPHLLDEALHAIDGALTQRPTTGGDRVESRREGVIGTS